jgi:superfamily II DNA or RNA helicase
MQLRDYQAIAVDYAVEWALAPGAKKLLLAAPTGTGKSLVALGIRSALEDGAWIVTPKIEIIAGFLNKMGVVVDGCSAQHVIDTAWLLSITTPIRLRNALLAGECAAPKYLIIDEAHHDLANSWQDIHPLCGYCPAIGLTATPYRGTPRGTAAFREQWGAPYWIITLTKASERGVLAFPDCRTVPLLDDDEIDVVNGELSLRQIETTTISRLAHIVATVAPYASGEMVGGVYQQLNIVNGWWDRPTMFSAPSTECAHALHRELLTASIPARVVTGETPYYDRQDAFARCIARRDAIIQVQVVSEGVDLPIRRLVDLSPTLSPVRWLQQLGRITRPTAAGEPPPDYLCTNRNLLRHGYLLEGLLPARTFSDAQKAFGMPARRTALRAVGLEAIGRLKPVQVPLKDGCGATMYNVAGMEGHVKRDYVILLHPAHEDVVWATRDNAKLDDGTLSYGRWHRCEPPADLEGYTSSSAGPLSDKQRAWWKRSAGNFGLDPAAEINRKQFAALPVLCDLRCKL